MEAVCIMLNIKPERKPEPGTGRMFDDYWAPSVKLLSDMKFLDKLKTYEKDNIPPPTIKRIREKYATLVMFLMCTTAFHYLDENAAYFDESLRDLGVWHVVLIMKVFDLLDHQGVWEPIFPSVLLEPRMVLPAKLHQIWPSFFHPGELEDLVEQHPHTHIYTMLYVCTLG